MAPAMRRRIERRLPLLVTALATVAIAACGVPGILLPEGGLLRDVYVRGSPSLPTVALTFDDGPNGRCTEAVLDALAGQRVQATFFVLGANLARGRNDALLARMVRDGHTVGIHGHTHRVRPLFHERLITGEIRAALDAVDRSLRRAGVVEPPRVAFFRPPFGLVTGATARAAAAAGLALVEWTVSVGDWQAGRRADEVTAAILARVRPGDVIVLHDGDETHQRSEERCVDRGVVPETVRLLVPALAADGLRVVPLPELLGFVAPKPAPRTGRRRD